MVGQTIGAKLAERGGDVVLGTRTPEQLDEKRGMGASLSEWLAPPGGGVGAARYVHRRRGARRVDHQCFCDTDSLGEQIQRAFPSAKVLKALNTTNAYIMVDPGQVASGDHDIFVSGNDAEARARVSSLLEQ